MKKFSFAQLNRASEIIGNISVAWFSGGVITPLIASSLNVIMFLTFFVLSLIMSVSFFALSLKIIEKINKEYDHIKFPKRFSISSSFK